MLTSQELINHYKLLPHPEGGWYKETYKSNVFIRQEALPPGFPRERSLATVIYFLLENQEFSGFHKIKSDECWHFYTGCCLLIYIINAYGNLDVIRLGSDLLRGEVFQYVVPAGCWFASKPGSNSGYSFVGCTVSPGFDFEDFELAKEAVLLKEYPQHKDIIRGLSR